MLPVWMVDPVHKVPLEMLDVTALSDMKVSAANTVSAEHIYQRFAVSTPFPVKNCSDVSWGLTTLVNFQSFANCWLLVPWPSVWIQGAESNCLIWFAEKFCLKNVQIAWKFPYLHFTVSDGSLTGDMCESNPCMFGGLCIAENHNYRCQCPPGRDGYNCREFLILQSSVNKRFLP